MVIEKSFHSEKQYFENEFQSFSESGYYHNNSKAINQQSSVLSRHFQNKIARRTNSGSSFMIPGSQNMFYTVNDSHSRSIATQKKTSIKQELPPPQTDFLEKNHLLDDNLVTYNSFI